MHSANVVEHALLLAVEGESASDIAHRLDVPRSTVRDWLAGSLPNSFRTQQLLGGPCRHDFSALPNGYVYLLGLHLGDGCISTHPRGVHRLRITLDAKYPVIIDAAFRALRTIRRGTAAVVWRSNNCVEVSAYWKCWPCLFPQLGPGKKHERRIELADWQTDLVSRHPKELLRGLIHSDGCRFQNTARCNWSCPRYVFSNMSDDIRAIFCSACEEIGVHWTAARTNTPVIYVSRKPDVALLDTFSGPKR